jgi:hypothetical protein
LFGKPKAYKRRKRCVCFATPIDTAAAIIIIIMHHLWHGIWHWVGPGNMLHSMEQNNILMMVAGFDVENKI